MDDQSKHSFHWQRYLWFFFFLAILAIVTLWWKKNPIPKAPIVTDIPETNELERPLPIPLFFASNPLSRDQLQFVFDGNQESSWLLPPGAGAGECLEIHFLQQQMPYIREMQIIPARGDSLSDIKQISVSVNNTSPLVISSGDFSFSLKQRVFSLRICLESIQEEIQRSFTENNEKVTILQMPPDRRCGIREILFLDEENNYYQALLPKQVQAVVEPSSNLNPLTSFHSGHLFDGQPATAWLEGKEDQNEPGKLHFQLEQSISPTYLVLWNGYQLSEVHYQEYSRLAAFTLISERLSIFSAFCRDQYGSQLIDFPNGIQLKDFTLQLDSLYQGSQYPNNALSELLFFEGEQPILLKTNWPERIRREKAVQVENTPLQAWIDQQVINFLEDPAGNSFIRKTICIAGDGSFYVRITRDQLLPEHRTQYEASGHWELQETSSELALLRLSGRSNRTDFARDSIPIALESSFNQLIEVHDNRLESSETLGRFFRQ